MLQCQTITIDSIWNLFLSSTTLYAFSCLHVSDDAKKQIHSVNISCQHYLTFNQWLVIVFQYSWKYKDRLTSWKYEYRPTDSRVRSALRLNTSNVFWIIQANNQKFRTFHSSFVQWVIYEERIEAMWPSLYGSLYRNYWIRVILHAWIVMYRMGSIHVMHVYI